MPEHVPVLLQSGGRCQSFADLYRKDGKNGAVSEWRVSSTYLEESGRKNSSTIFCDRARATVKSGIMFKENPVRAGLVRSSDEWPWQGEMESLML